MKGVSSGDNRVWLDPQLNLQTYQLKTGVRFQQQQQKNQPKITNQKQYNIQKIIIFFVLFC